MVAGILKDFGWGVVDIGGIEGSRYLEAMCLVWVLFAFSTTPPTRVDTDATNVGTPVADVDR